MKQKEFAVVLIKIRNKMLRNLRRDGFWYKGKYRHDATTWDINNGSCEDFANEVIDAVPTAEMGGVDELEGHHIFISWQGKCYDAECIGGVRDYKKLPIFLNRGKTREQVLQEREGKDD